MSGPRRGVGSRIQRVEGCGDDLGKRTLTTPGENAVLGEVCGARAFSGPISPGGWLLGRHHGSFRLLLLPAWPPSSRLSQALPLLRRL